MATDHHDNILISEEIPSSHSFWGRRARSIILHEKVVVVVMTLSYLITILHCYYSQDVFSMWIHIGCIISTLLVNFQFIVWSTRWKTHSIHLKFTNELVRILTTSLLFSIRFFFLYSNKFILLPTSMMVITSANKFNGENATVLGVFPSYWILSHYIGYGLWKTYDVLSSQGLNSNSMDVLSEIFIVALTFLMFTFYLVTITERLRYKVKTLKETQKDLEVALEVCNLHRFNLHLCRQRIDLLGKHFSIGI